MTRVYRLKTFSSVVVVILSTEKYLSRTFIYRSGSKFTSPTQSKQSKGCPAIYLNRKKIMAGKRKSNFDSKVIDIWYATSSSHLVLTLLTGHSDFYF